MTLGDGTGPLGQRPGSGRGMGGGRGRGMGRGRGGRNRPGAGPDGYYICPICGTKVTHKIGIPCYSINCPKCNKNMVRG